MDESSNDVVPFVEEIQVVPMSSSSPNCSGPSKISMGGRMEGRSYTSSVEESIENSKSHWSELREFDSGGEMAEVSNKEIFQTLQRHPTWGAFFMTFGKGVDSWGELVLGRKFAEGGQAELYEVQVEWLRGAMREEVSSKGCEWVLKVFKKGTFLQDLQVQWPQGMLRLEADKLKHWKLGLRGLVRYHSDVFGGTLLEDMRFAFLMVREQEDLRSFIDRRLIVVNDNMGPLSNEEALETMYGVARGMNQLHDYGIVHRDLKASNVLVSCKGNCHVADFECSVGVVGTGFFRAPEILQACKHRTVSSRAELFTKAADVYSYGMVCYEILTGKLPFEGHPLNDYDLVINGGRPEVPQHIDGWIRKLLYRCWDSNPASRPSSREILETLVANSVLCWGRNLENQMQELKFGFHDDLGQNWMIIEKWRWLRLKLQMYWFCKLQRHFPNRL